MITEEQIKVNIEIVNNEIDRLYDVLKELQDSCPHSKAEKKYGSSTGNYDPSSDCYWIDYFCSSCQKRWVEPVQTTVGTR